MTKAISIRSDGTWTGQALIKLEEMAAANRTQGTIAAEFDLPKREFEAILAKNKGRNEVRVAWERGRARIEQTLMDGMFSTAMGTITEAPELVDVRDEHGTPTGEKKTILVRTVNISKAASIEKMFLLKTQFGWKEGESADAKVSNVTLMLPKPRTRAEYFAIMGITDPAALPAPEPMKTVTESVPALPAPVEKPKEPVR